MKLPKYQQVAQIVRVQVADGLLTAGTGRHTQGTAVAPAFELPDGTAFNRAPKDMCSWEIHAAYRHAWHLAYFRPSANLAQALANWLCAAQRELERRGDWQPESLPPQSM